MTIRVLLADDHAVVRMGLAAVLTTSTDFQVIAEAGDGEQAVDLVMTRDVDVLLLDLLMPKLDGVAVIRRIRASGKVTPIVVLTSSVEDTHVFAALQAGATSYLLKTSSAQEIRTALIRAVAGKSTLSPDVQRQVVMQLQNPSMSNGLDALTDRERQVLEVLASGKSNQQIADILHIGLKTVKSHVSNIFIKLDVEDRTQAAIFAIRHGLV